MGIRKRVLYVLLGGVYCATVGSLLAGIVVFLIGVIQDWPQNMESAATFFLAAIVFAAIPAAPFGLILGSLGSWWLTARMTSSVSAKRVYFESAGIGASLGATFPLIATILGWAPFHNLVSVLPLSIGIGIVCAATLALLMRRRMLR